METAAAQNKIKILIVEDQFIEAYDLQLILENAGYKVIGIAHSVLQAEAVLAKEKPDLVCLDIFLDEHETGIDLAKKLKEVHIGFIYISANSGKSILDEVKKTQPYGFILKPFREQDVLTTLEIACYRHRHTAASLLHESGILQKDIQGLCNTDIPWDASLLQLCKTIQGYLPFDYMEAGYNEIGEQDYDTLGFFRRNFEEYARIDSQRFADLTILTSAELTKLKKESPQHIKAAIFSKQSFILFCEKSPISRLVVQSFGIKSFIAIPVRLQNGQLFCFTFYSKQPEIYTSEHLNLLTHLESSLALLVTQKHIASNNKNETKQIAPVATKLAPFEGIIGNSKKMHTVFDYIKKVSPSDTSVLILGESGTGKEKIAHAIHRLSSRSEKSFIIVNCGAIPDNLAESMLFGHEKGSFTGALERRIGKFELADNGTIFLDEIGEMPMNLQVKLLRVLQENEIERVGGKSPIKINARIIAATNKNLEEEVASGRFRMDLYYRLHIFPILMPSLRERKDDIPALVEHFVMLYSKKMGRKPLSIHENILEQISAYEWPGNIRQLEHALQRAILLTEGSSIKEIQLPRMQEQQIATADLSQERVIKTINENERDYICYILKKCKGKVYGAGGAAELLDIPASTLNSKIKKLGIKIKAF